MAIDRGRGVLCAGSICFDILMRPVDDLQWGTSTWVDEFIEDLGGNGGNTAYTLAKLGTPVRLLSMVGSDSQGERVTARLREAGVDLSLVERAEGLTTTTVCIVNSDGNRFFLKRLGVSHETFAQPIEFTRSLIGSHTHFHMANLFSLPNLSRHGAKILRQAREAGLSTSLDTGWDPEQRWIERVGPCLQYTDLLFVNQEEAEMLTGSTEPETVALSLRRHGVRDVIMKLGAGGCAVLTHEGSHYVPGVSVDVVDTTGAGDCFAGAFLTALYRGESYAEAARFANAVGAMAVEKLGAVAAVQSFEDTMQWIKDRLQSM